MTNAAVRFSRLAIFGLVVVAVAILASSGVRDLRASPPLDDRGLLFYLSGDRGFTADKAARNPEPNFQANVRLIPDGARGGAISCDHTQLLSYRAPGNIYAQRGTLSFFWRSREAVGPTEFPIFRVGYADHSSWDMVFLRIDYNGHGFDAFVTDISLARTRLSVNLPVFPAAGDWTHLAISWDETQGVRFYIDGRLAAVKETRAVYDAGLDQFGPHSRIISPYQVQSAYNFVRGGDLDELRIYDHMLADEEVLALARQAEAPAVAPLSRDANDLRWRQEWWHRYGWDLEAPAMLRARATSVRKVEIQDVYDIKRWWWKATDGIRETTWPGVYNRSRLPGRLDYFVLPDWDCYSESGKSVRFLMPDEPWNHLEIAGAAWGTMTAISGSREARLFARPEGVYKTAHALTSPVRGGTLRFDNAIQETPIGELSAYHVAAGVEPAGAHTLAYVLSGAANPAPASEPVYDFIVGRFPPDERQTMVARPAGATAGTRPTYSDVGMPLVHVIVPGPRSTTDDDGLDGIAIDLPPLAVRATHGGAFPLNIRIKDPLWLHRDLFDFSFSVKPGEARTLWLDTRDRILPPGKSLYVTLAGAGPDFGPSSLEGATLRLVFKSRDAAKTEHALDRFTQARDLYAHIVEERPTSPKLDLYNRFKGDLDDLLRVDPTNQRGLEYRYEGVPGSPKPPFAQPPAPAGVPVWAFRQVELLRRLEHVVFWVIDKRQIANGELGGGLSDDGDLTNVWPGMAFMGSAPDKIADSLRREADAFYAQGMFTNGLPTIQTDELHSYEEGIQALSQVMMLDYGSPRQIERAMETTRGVEGITAVNTAGHRHIRSSYYSGTKVATDSVWGVAKTASYLVLHPAFELVEFNGNPRAKRLVVEVADGLLQHRRQDKDGRFRLDATIRFDTDAGTPGPLGRVWGLFWAALIWTGDAKYGAPLLDVGPDILTQINGNALDVLGVRDRWRDQVVPNATGNQRHTAWQLTGDLKYLEALYADQIEAAAHREYYNTDGHPWIDRIVVNTAEIQRSRLGGVALVRNAIYPGHLVSWRFTPPATAQSVAILVSDPQPNRMTIRAFNLETRPVDVQMTAWGVDPGSWRVTQAVDDAGAPASGSGAVSREVALERTTTLALRFPPRATSRVTLELITPGTPYWSRPDLGIDPQDVTVTDLRVSVVVHSLGSVPAPPTTVAVLNAAGLIVASAPMTALDAPTDLRPRTTTVTLALPPGVDRGRWTVVIDPEHRLTEITRRNNVVTLLPDPPAPARPTLTGAR
jgi:hypothetical protein